MVKSNTIKLRGMAYYLLHSELFVCGLNELFSCIELWMAGLLDSFNK